MVDYISLKEASKYCHYSQDYLKLRARQGKLKAVKMGRNWFTTKDWLKKYQQRSAKNTVKLINWQKYLKLIFILLLFIIFFAGFLSLSNLHDNIERIIPARIIEIEREIE